MEGWSGAHDWQGFLPFEGQPQTLDPAWTLVNANNRPAPADWPYLDQREPRIRFRAARIGERADGWKRPDARGQAPACRPTQCR